MRFPKELSVGGTVVARYVWQPDLPANVSPRPYLHPVGTLAGVEVTELMPADHVHHLGVSVAIPDVSGRNFWGGRTYVRDQGPVALDNHGTQRHVGWRYTGPDALTEELAWVDARGITVFAERRTVAAHPVADAWVLDLAFELTNVDTTAQVVGSPATNGRAGAGYGGYFWRAPASSRDIEAFSPGARGESAVHGHPARWLAMTGVAPDGRGWTLALAAGDARTGEDPWFVRVAEYPGVGSSLAWSRPVTVDPGGRLSRRVSAIVADGVRTADQVAELMRERVTPVRTTRD